MRSESSLATLRKKTGYALNLCKKALNETQNDVSAAELWLKEEAIKNGWKKASALGNKPVAEGLVGVFVNRNSESAVLLEVNCESDFVSRNEEFRKLVSHLTRTIADSTVVRSESPSEVANVKKYSVTEEQLEVFQESVVAMITKLGEKIRLRRALLFLNPTSNTRNPTSNKSEPVKFVSYAHAVGGQPNQLDGVHIGKYGTLVAFKESFNPADDVELATKESKKEESEKEESEKEVETKGSEEDEELESTAMELDGVTKSQVAHFIAQHIIGLKPTKIKKSPEEVEQEEKLRKEGYKISDEDAETLLDQKFLLNDFFTVRQILKVKDMQIVDFERFECGVKDV